MTIKAVNAVQQVQKTKNSKITNPAIRGALISSAVYTASTGINFISHPNEIKQCIKNAGGKKEVSLAFTSGLVIVALLGGIINTALYKITENTFSKEK